MDFLTLLTNEYGLASGINGKFIKHGESGRDLRLLWISNKLELYQSFQSRDVFNCDYIFTFIGEGKDKARFLGIYQVLAHQPAHQTAHSEEERRSVFAEGAAIFYDLRRVPGFEDAEGRIIIKWGRSQQWHQWVHDNPKKIWQILPTGFYKPFPGIENVSLLFSEVKAIINNKDANIEWYFGLSGCKGVYTILDTATGQQYIGSAISSEGIWRRWAEYVVTCGDGGNVKLQEILGSAPRRADGFQFSVLKFFPKEIDNQVVLKAEKFLKRALGTRVVGLNAN